MTDKIDKFRGTTTRIPLRDRGGSYLVDETFLMEQERRSKEQQGHRQLAKVHAVEHAEPRAAAPGEEPGLHADVKQHPYLDIQAFDGMADNESPLPSVDPLAAIDYENAKREQQLELTKRLNLNYAPGTAPTPKPG